MKRKLLSILLALAMMVAYMPAQTLTVAAASKAKTKATVSTQAGLKKALKNKKLKTLTIKTSKKRTFTIKKGTYKKVKVVVNAPKSSVKNSARFKKVTINKISTNGWTEKAKGNTIVVNDKNAVVVVAKVAVVKEIKVGKKAVGATVTNNSDFIVKMGLVILKPGVTAILSYNGAEGIDVIDVRNSVDLPKFKAVYDTTNGANTLTFYYDAKDHSGDNKTVYEGSIGDHFLFDNSKFEEQKWGYNAIRGYVKSVVIDSSVNQYKGLTSTESMFENFCDANSIVGAQYLDVSNVTNMEAMFSLFGCYSDTLQTVPDVSKWVTSKVTDMSEIFFGYAAYSKVIEETPDVSKWDTTNVNDMCQAFRFYAECSSRLNFTLDLSQWSAAKLNYSDKCFLELAGYSTNNWKVIIPKKTGTKQNDETHWYAGNGKDYIAPASGKKFTVSFNY